MGDASRPRGISSPLDDQPDLYALVEHLMGVHAPAAEFGGVEFYEDLPSKAAVLCSRLVRNHPLPDGNKRAGYISMLEFIARNGGRWTYPPNDPEGDETVDIIERLAAGAYPRTNSKRGSVNGSDPKHPDPR